LEYSIVVEASSPALSHSTALGVACRDVTITLREITDDTIDSVRALRTRPEQERFVSSVVGSLAEAAEVPQANPWVRAVYADDLPVGFVMLAWNVDPQPPGIIGPWFLWKLLIDHHHQGLGYGHEVMRQIVELIRSHGATELLTSYGLGDGSPVGFYEALGFVPTGAVNDDGEVLARLRLDGPLPTLAS
jgi:GNAT superfamily N-acetyltransferase